jgi:hypothetical protein
MSNGKSSRNSRRGRRRFFRPAKEKVTQPPTLPQLASHQEASPRRRKARRASAGTEAEVEYIPPLSVFIYTHTTHPEMRDSYEFRPEHFSRGGRRIEDFHIDISSLFVEDSGNAEDSTPLLKGLPKPKFNWADWEEEE